jgi:hypothetical protein
MQVLCRGGPLDGQWLELAESEPPVVWHSCSDGTTTAIYRRCVIYREGRHVIYRHVANTRTEEMKNHEGDGRWYGSSDCYWGAHCLAPRA